MSLRSRIKARQRQPSAATPVSNRTPDAAPFVPPSALIPARAPANEPTVNRPDPVAASLAEAAGSIVPPSALIPPTTTTPDSGQPAGQGGASFFAGGLLKAIALPLLAVLVAILAYRKFKK